MFVVHSYYHVYMQIVKCIGQGKAFERSQLKFLTCSHAGCMQVIANITKRMGDGMAEFISKGEVKGQWDRCTGCENVRAGAQAGSALC